MGLVSRVAGLLDSRLGQRWYWDGEMCDGRGFL
jgi:hypothetical protein